MKRLYERAIKAFRTRARKLQGRVEPVKVVLFGNGLIYETALALFTADCQE